ncbi:MAG: ABC transporter substrate-binding protein [Sneathiella sp.]|nr:ABC transporter substrate-binding protein [Sneathiella sp.]
MKRAMTLIRKICLGAGLVSGLMMPGVSLAEVPSLQQSVTLGELPPMAERLPENPRMVEFSEEQQVGRYGGTLRTLIGNPSDVKLLFVYGYARLVGFNQDLELVPDILESFEVEENRIFTLHLRKGHRWSDGASFTSEDFRYWWEDVANNPKLTPAGPPAALLANDQLPTVSFPDAYTVRYEWATPNPNFLPQLAGASPLLIYRPSHYLKPFHIKYIDQSKLNKIQKIKLKAWASKHNRLDNLYKFDNPELPTLQPWRNTTSAPATRFVGVRNPYFHRVDTSGNQLPYIDRVVLSVSEPKLISAKAASGDVDLQVRAIKLQDATFLKENETRSDYRTLLWPTVKGSQFVLYPNLNASDPEWRELLRDVRFRRALSLAIDREEINDVLYFGIATEGNNTVQKQSPLFKEEYRTRWATLDFEKANELLDEMGLTERNENGIRLTANGQELSIIVETAGESTEQTDALELIRDSWREIGIALFTKPSQRAVFRNRIFSGETLISVWWGLENGVPTAEASPSVLAPTSQISYQWPKWGQYYETKGASGEEIDMPEAKRLMELYKSWQLALDNKTRTEIWQEMLSIHAEQQFTIGVVSGILQPVVATNRLQNVPKSAIFNWDPGAHFGMYLPDTFYFTDGGKEE